MNALTNLIQALISLTLVIVAVAFFWATLYSKTEARN